MSSNTWLWSPLVAVLLASIVLAWYDAPGMDGAARSAAAVFWFLPTILLMGIKSITCWSRASLRTPYKVLLVCAWLLPSLPLGVLSFMGCALILETGFDVLF